MSSKKKYPDFRGPTEDTRLLSSVEDDFDDLDPLMSQSLPHSYMSGRGRFYSIAGIPTQAEKERDRKSSSSRGRKRRKKKSQHEIFDEEEGAVDLSNAVRRYHHRVRSGAKSMSASFQASPATPHDHLRVDGGASFPPSHRNSNEFDDSLRPPAQDYNCLVARTALVLPFKWANAMDADLSDWVAHSLERTIIGPDGEIIPLWQMRQQLPYEITDLDPHFRELLGARMFYDDEEEFDFDAIYHKSAWGHGPVATPARHRPVPTAGLASLASKPHLHQHHHQHNQQRAQPSASDQHQQQDADAFLEDEDDPLDDYCQRLDINPAVLDSLFAKARLCASMGEKIGDDDGAVTCPVKIENFEMVAFPLGTAILVVHINWMPDDCGMTLDELRSWLHLSKYQYRVPGIQEGWLFRGDSDDRSNFPDVHLRSLGTALVSAIYARTPVSLSAIGNWLLRGEDEDPDVPPNRLGRYVKRCYHHSCVVIDKRPSQAEIQEYLFHLRRAQGNENRPSPSESGSDAILIPKTNRYIGVSRSGTACLSWPSSMAELDYEVNKWSKKMMGIYLILSAHVYGEKSVLLELSNLSSDSAKLLKGIHRVSLSKMYSSRMELIKLATLMTRYTLQMSSDDCGGLPEYVEFFTALRSLFGIRQQREELREEIQDVLALIETNYNEEQRKMRTLEKQEREKSEGRRRVIELKSEAFKARYERFVTVVSSFTIPFVLVAGIWGMNLDDLPQWSFWPLMGATTAASMALLIILICIFRRPPAVQQEEEDMIREETEPKLLARGVQSTPARSKENEKDISKYDPEIMESAIRRRLEESDAEKYGSFRMSTMRNIDINRALTYHGVEPGNGPEAPPPSLRNSSAMKHMASRTPYGV